MGGMDSIPAGCWNSLQPLAILRGTEPVSALTHTILSCSALYNLSLAFRQWRSCADRVLTLNKNIRLPTWGSGLGPGLGHMCWPGVWAVTKAIVLPQSRFSTGSVESWIAENTSQIILSCTLHRFFHTHGSATSAVVESAATPRVM